LLVDTHCHLNLAQFTGDLDEVIERSLENGIQKIIVPGVDIPTCEKAIEISHHYDQVYSAIGIHPNYASAFSPIDLPHLESLAQESKVVAIGEIGLDKYRDYSPLEIQISLLEAQLEISRNTGLPVIIHSRSAVPELLSILTKWHNHLEEIKSPLTKRPGVMHAFEGSLEEAFSLFDLNFVFGLGGAATYNPPRVDQKIFSGLSIGSIVFETDSPYLPPASQRGNRNEPAFMVETIKTVSGKMNITYEEICKISTKTANSIFSLGVIF